MKRNRVLAIALTGVVASGAVGWVAGTRVQSSNEAAAAAGAPDASAVTAAVKKQALSADIVTRGTAQYGEPQKVSLAGGGGSLVTKPPVAGTDVAEGTAFMEVNGLPVFALEGERPMYRDLGPGDTGEDVRQLEEALDRLGFAPGPVDGIYDGATVAAVGRWYSAAGYAAEGPTDAEEAELRSTNSQVDQAESQLASAQRQLADGTEPPTETELLQAESDLRQAQDGLETAKLNAAEKLKTAERTLTAKYDAHEAAKEQALEDAKDAQRLVDQKYVAAEVARANLSDARNGGGPNGPVSQASILQMQQSVRDADQALADARAARDAQPAKSQKAIDEAKLALDDARAAVPRAKSEGESSVRNAETTLTLAQLRLKSLREPKTNESLSANVRDAQEALQKARESLAETEAAVGAKVPASSVVFFDSLPLRIDSVAIERGDAATGEVMTVSGAELVIDAAVNVADAKLLSVGMDVTIDAPDLALTLQGRISRIAEKPGTDGVTAQQVHIEIEPIEPPENFKDAAVRLTIPVKSTAGEVLVVPVAAVTSGSDGAARVERVSDDGTRTQVPVTVGLSSGGLVEVAPLNGLLNEGDRVVVGAQ